MPFEGLAQPISPGTANGQGKNALQKTGVCSVSCDMKRRATKTFLDVSPHTGLDQGRDGERIRLGTTVYSLWGGHRFHRYSVQTLQHASKSDLEWAGLLCPNIRIPHRCYNIRPGASERANGDESHGSSLRFGRFGWGQMILEIARTRYASPPGRLDIAHARFSSPAVGIANGGTPHALTNMVM